jgi:hypothetical protein
MLNMMTQSLANVKTISSIFLAVGHLHLAEKGGIILSVKLVFWELPKALHRLQSLS